MLPTDVHSWPSWWQISWRRSWLPRRKLRRLSGKRRHRHPPRHPAESGQRPSAGQGRNQSPTSQHRTSVYLAKSFPHFRSSSFDCSTMFDDAEFGAKCCFSEENALKTGFVFCGNRREKRISRNRLMYRRTNETVSSLLNHHSNKQCDDLRTEYVLKCFRLFRVCIINARTNLRHMMGSWTADSTPMTWWISL